VTTIPVNVDNFPRAETDHMLAGVLPLAGGVNRWMHNRVPTPLDQQPVIRQNRDTLYSAAIVDISAGATLSLPDAGERYQSAMVVNQDHYINDVFHDAGDYELSVDRHGSPYVAVAVRLLVDPDDPADVDEVAALQDRLGLEARSARPFELPPYDVDSYTETRQSLLTLAKGIGDFTHTFGRREDVDPVHHLIGTAAGWGGLPDAEATYLNVNPGLPVGAYQLTVPADVPVDGFWSVSLYDADGYFPTDTGGRVSVNSITADRNADGSVTVSFGGDASRPNQLPVMEGWNYLVRLYRPRPEVLDRTWTFPTLTT
jgi:hypothetical protein